jgi:hypothetical protein
VFSNDSLARNRDSSVGIVMGCTTGVRFPSGARYFSLLHSFQAGSGAHPPGLLSSGYKGLFHDGKSGRGVKLTTQLHLEPRIRMMELYLHSPIRLNGVMLT